MSRVDAVRSVDKGKNVRMLLEKLIWGIKHGASIICTRHRRPVS